MTVSSFAEATPVSSAPPWKAALDDPLHRVLNHAALVARQALGADEVEFRLFQTPDDGNPTVVAMPGQNGNAGEVWLPDSPRFCVQARQTVRARHAFDPRATLGRPGDGWGDGRRSQPDVFCVIEDVHAERWLLVSFRRGTDRPGFSEQDYRTAEQICAAVAGQLGDVVAPLDKRVDRRLAALGVRHSLTEAETKVAAYLLGTTLSEQAIAAELHRSFNTIHRHVTNIYRKLGVRSRLEAMAMLDEGVPRPFVRPMTNGHSSNN